MLGMQQVLFPDDLRLTAEAFDKALGLLSEAFDLQTATVRRLVALQVIDAALSGERDPARLRDKALACVHSVVGERAAV
jgi:hypothetical protein